ncbi:MAG: SRPBCC family protein [Acidobacteriota bacterium]|nr:SRPBCC family protein [Acidobacteriota bacterium]
MTIKTSYAGSEFLLERGREKAHSSAKIAATILTGTALAAVGIVRRGWTGAALALGGSYLIYRGVADNAVPHSDKVRVGFTINKSPDEVYAFVRNYANWPSFLQGFTMEPQGDSSLKITVGQSAGFSIDSHIAVTDEAPGKHIAWSSLPGPVQHRGVIRFNDAPGKRGTEIQVAFEYQIPAGMVARGLASMVGWDPEQLTKESLRHLKQLLEAGELPTITGQPVGERGVKGAALRVLYREGSADDAMEQTRLAGD